MARSYTGDSPCPSCGKTGTESRRSCKDSVCYRCLDDLRKYKDICKRNETNKDAFVAFEVIRHNIPYLSCNEDYSNLIGALRQLFISLDTPEMDKFSTDTPKVTHGTYYANSFNIRRSYDYVYDGYKCSGDAPFIIREDIALNLCSLITAIENYSKTLWQNGKVEGGNLLKRLGTQEINPDEFLGEINKK